jgi:urease accessory protein UreE
VWVAGQSEAWSFRISPVSKLLEQTKVSVQAMKKPVQKKTKNKPVWYHHHNDERYPVTLNALIDMFEILHDEVLISGDEHTTMFLMDMMQAFREGKPIRQEFGLVARHKWLHKENTNG